MSARPSDVVARADGDLLRHPRRALVVASSLLLVVVLMTALVAARPDSPPVLGAMDRWWRGLMQPPPPWAESVSRVLKLLGSGWVMVPFRISVAAWLLARRRRYDLAAWLLAWVAADLLTFALKPGVGRIRPDGAHASSFPSAHAKTAAQVAVGLVLVGSSPWRSRAVPWALAALWIVAMALSRTVLDEHWLSDVVAGSSLGAACAVGVSAVVQLRRRVPAPGG